MDIDLLSKMVKELILDNDIVVLPGFGAFVAEIVPSTFSDKGYTINPPYRKLYFRNRAEEDMKLIQFYASSNNVELAVADKVIRDFVSELRSVLFARKTVVFPGLGRLRATKENAVFFVSDEDLDIYPEGFGLEPISLKTHVETREEISEAVAGLKAIVTGPVAEPEPIVEAPVAEPEPVVEEPVAEPEPVAGPEPVAEPEPVVEPMEEQQPVMDNEPVIEPEPAAAEPAAAEPDAAEPVGEPEQDTAPQQPEMPAKKRSGWKIFWITILCLVLAAALFFGAFMAAAHWAPEMLDNLLYTQEELQILNYQ